MPTSSRPSSSESHEPPSTNEEWIDALQGPDRDTAAIRELRRTLVRGLRAALQTRVPDRADALAEDFAQDALVKILDRLDTFRGESKLTTWAQKIAVRTALSELRRKRWENVSLQDITPEGENPAPTRSPTAPAETSPAEATSQQMLVERVRRVMEEELTERQRTALTAVIRDMPIREVARRMDTNRNALYKVIHDARKNMKTALRDRYDLSPNQLPAVLN